jgi:hypothetical protein
MNLRKQAKGRNCQIRLYGCNHDPSTTVLCHLNSKLLFGAGMGMKVDDIFGAWGCSHCHALVDGRLSDMHSQSYVTLDERVLGFYEGVFRTQKILLDEEKIIIPA